MPPLYTAIGPDYRIGPMDAEALVAELRRRSAPPTTTIIRHLEMGDRAAPLAHFPELKWTHQGTPFTASYRYHTLWRRLGASLIDLIVVAPFLIYALVVNPPLFSWQPWLVEAATFLLVSTYFIYFHARGGQTLGKKLVGVRVVHAVGEEGITLGQSVKRESPFLLISSTLFTLEAMIIAAGREPAPEGLFVLYGILSQLPNLWSWVDAVTALTNSKRRTLHDFFGSTVVVRCDGAPAGSPPPLPIAQDLPLTDLH